jgi:GDPmannose 4,6-dehydratase
VSARVDRAALITGVAGQDGVYLSRLLLSEGYRVVGSVRPGGAEAARMAPYLAGVEIVEVDVCDAEAMRALLRRSRPHEVYNLAALSSVGSSWTDTDRVNEVNNLAVLRLLENLLHYRDEYGDAPRLFQASSAEIFGAADEQPQNERTPHDPGSPYAAAKSAAHDRVMSYRETQGLFACNGILFSHESPLRGTSFVTRKITRGAVEISAGRRAELALGNLDVRRDWGAAADYVRAMWLMLQQPVADDYVIATGTSSSLRDFVELAFAEVGISDAWQYVRTDPTLMRPADIPQTWGDPSRANRELGWTASLTVEQVVVAMVSIDQQRLRRGVDESPEFLSAPT